MGQRANQVSLEPIALSAQTAKDREFFLMTLSLRRKTDHQAQHFLVEVVLSIRRSHRSYL